MNCRCGYKMIHLGDNAGEIIFYCTNCGLACKNDFNGTVVWYTHNEEN